MLSFSTTGISFTHNGITEISEGPYGYLILGLVYKWNDNAKCYEIKNVILVEVDMKLKYSVELPVYYDTLEHPFEEIYEENGKHFFRNKPVLNFGMVNIPKTLTDIKEDPWSHETSRRFYNTTGPLKYSVNPICTGWGGFRDRYIEFYACILSFDEKTQTATGVGFDVLGKIEESNYPMISIDRLRKELINVSRLNRHKSGEEEYDRAMEFNFLNLSCETDEQGNRVYTYKSVWDEE